MHAALSTSGSDDGETADLDARLIGVNNRDLTTFATDLTTTEMLAKRFSKQLQQQDVLLVSESGLTSRADLDRVHAAGARAVLVGESLMRQQDVKAALQSLIRR